MRPWGVSGALENPVNQPSAMDRSRAPTVSGPLDPLQWAFLMYVASKNTAPATKISGDASNDNCSVEKKSSRPYWVEKSNPSRAVAAAQTKTNDGSRAILREASQTFCGVSSWDQVRMYSRREMACRSVSVVALTSSVRPRDPSMVIVLAPVRGAVRFQTPVSYTHLTLPTKG